MRERYIDNNGPLVNNWLECQGLEQYWGHYVDGSPWEAPKVLALSPISERINGLQAIDQVFPFGNASDQFYTTVPFTVSQAQFMPWQTEYMSDQVSGNSKNRFNDCLHYKIKQGFNPTSKNCSDVYVEFPSPDWIMPVPSSELPTGEDHLHYIWYKTIPLRAVARYHAYANMPDFIFGDGVPEGIQAALDIAYTRMRPTTSQLTGEANILLFLAELRDFRELLSICHLRGSTINRLRSVFKGDNLTFAELARQVLHLGAEFRLTMQYAVKPFISDVKAIYKAFTILDRRLSQWNHYARQSSLMSRHMDLTKWLPNAYPWPNSTVEADSGTCHITVTSSREFKSNATLRFEPEPFDMTQWKGLRKYHDAIGAGKFLSIAWELIPFSFLVDYVATVGDLVEQFDTALAELPISNQVLMWTSKWRIHQRTEASWRHPFTGVKSMASVDSEYSCFSRRVVPAPDMELEPWRRYRHEALVVKVPGLEQLKNVVALIIANLT